MDAQHAIERGIAAAQANNQRTAYYYFYTATQADPNNEQAWLWRASAAPEPRDALFCLAAVLALNPENPVAKHGIEQISAAVAAESPPEPQTITPSLTSDEYKPPERRLAWQQAFQRELYDMARVPRMQPVADRTESATQGAPPGEIGAAYRRPPPTPGRRATEALRRIIVDRETQRVRLAVPAGIAVLVLLALVTFLGLNGGSKPAAPVGTTTPAPPPPTLPSSGRVITPAPRRTPAGTVALTLVAGGPTAAATPVANAPTAPPPPAPPTLTPVPPTAVIVVVPTLPPTGPTAVPPTKAPAATPVPPTAVATGPKTVTLADGQSLQAVAQAQGVTLGALLAYNNIADLYGVAAGTTLKIPPADYKPAEAHYTIRSGDNLTNIARLFGTTVDAITALNGIDNPNAIFAGEVLRIPLQ